MIVTLKSSELNKILAAAPTTVGLGKRSQLRTTLADFAHFLRLSAEQPSHITEIVGPNLPHIYGYTDASRTGMGGVILPATRWIPPTVWRFNFPARIQHLFDDGNISINDLEAAANFVAERLTEQLLDGNIAGLSTWFGCDNRATVSGKTKKAARSSASGKVDSTMVNKFEERRSRGRYVSARSSWWPKDFETLADQLKANIGSTQH